MLESVLNLEVVRNKEFVTMKYSASDKFLWNEWRGNPSSTDLREAIIFSCEFILENEVELILADFIKFCPPTLEDQVWIATHSAKLLQHSKLKRVANLLSQDVFQQIAIETIYDKAAEIPQPCECKNFMFTADAMEWLLS